MPPATLRKDVGTLILKASTKLPSQQLIIAETVVSNYRKIETLDTFLEFLSREEFAFFYTFRRMEFLEDSKEIIEKHKALKKLSESEIKSIVDNQKVIFNQNCPRCQAANFERITDYDIAIAANVPIEKHIHSRRCRICGYNAYKNNTLNWKMALRKLWNIEYWVEVK